MFHPINVYTSKEAQFLFFGFEFSKVLFVLFVKTHARILCTNEKNMFMIIEELSHASTLMLMLDGWHKDSCMGAW